MTHEKMFHFSEKVEHLIKGRRSASFASSLRELCG